MGWFKKSKPTTWLEEVRQVTARVMEEIDEARKMLAKNEAFDPRNGRHLKLARTIMTLATNIPETRGADARSAGWSEAKYPPFTVSSWSGSLEGRFSHSQRIFYQGQLVFDWVSEAGWEEEFRVVRFGSWCYELFDIVRKVRREVEASALESQTETERRAAEFEANRFKPFEPDK